MSATYTSHAYEQYSPYCTPPGVLQPNRNHPEPGAIPLSSYSSLAGALEPATVTTRTRSHSIHKGKPSAAAHPYHDPPERKMTSPGRSGKRRPRDDPHARTPYEPKPSGPTNHVLVPQPRCREEPSYIDPSFRYPPVTFQTVNIPELGVRVAKIAERYFPSVIGGSDEVFASINLKEIKFWIIWPGYPEPMLKKMKTLNGTISRDTVLMILGNALLEFTRNIEKEGTRIERGFEDWAIGPGSGGRGGISGPSLFITRLIHRGGANWQPEIWAPKRF